LAHSSIKELVEELEKEHKLKNYSNMESVIDRLKLQIEENQNFVDAVSF
jgi:hypothetical protein